MHRSISIDPTQAFTVRDDAELRDLAIAVNAPEDAASWPGKRLEWAPAQWYVRARDTSGRLASITGIVIRQAIHDGRDVRIGGIGSVRTHPEMGRQGWAARTVTCAVEFLRAQSDAEFGLLVCDGGLISYYSRLGWHEFTGCLLIRNAAATVVFTLARVMTCDIRSAGPRTGTIDLCGPPW